MGEDVKIAPQFIPPPLAATQTTAHTTKSNFFRVIHVDGVFGGPAPTPGNIAMTVFSLRFAFPEKTVSDGYGNEIIQKRIAKDGVEQEYEASLIMNVETAKTIAEWLTATVKNVERMTQTWNEHK